MSYTSSCHCGGVSATVDGELPTSAISCNCSICRRRGHVLHFVPADTADLAADSGILSDYTFNKNVIHHQFCGTCGCAPFGRGIDSEGKEMVSINLSCVPNCDLDALEITAFDGAAR